MVLKSIGVASCAKLMGAMYAAIGLILGAIFALLALLGAGLGGDAGAAGMMFGVGAVVFLPIFYGVLGFIGGALMALVYNVVAGIAGGLELELE